MCSFRIAIAGQHVAILMGFLVIQRVGTVPSLLSLRLLQQRQLPRAPPYVLPSLSSTLLPLHVMPPLQQAPCPPLQL